ncbi:MAG TPA: sulfite exporter TauE/SafE family protein [Candidatus Intestinimonas pullistercoris]|uniref:Probable membrane transporter protein n=1 Tax=Candidatus Intestinimonas pullistercoris TaxID=2838623 RepID=A0A9D2P0D5_9FIRM|nr:sulfite exporter TauE/SafE family protein [uncultured Intestinimonas sp.]HJC40113.1 sulfite exporter TauE/SafE family protein [Candidatus Intestinimonas pullistercoris]
MEKKRPWLAPAVAGGLAGVANGFFGGGGGMVLVPLLTGRCGLDQRRAFATSVAIILPLCVLSSVIYFFRGGLDLSAALPYLLGGLAGGWIGGRVFRRLNMDWLRRAFALLILYGGVRSLLAL